MGCDEPSLHHPIIGVLLHKCDCGFALVRPALFLAMRAVPRGSSVLIKLVRIVFVASAASTLWGCDAQQSDPRSDSDDKRLFKDRNGNGVMEVYEDPSQPRACLLYTSPSPRDKRQSRMPSSA